MIPGSAPHIWENNLESDKRRDTALLLELLCLCAKKKSRLRLFFALHPIRSPRQSGTLQRRKGGKIRRLRGGNTSSVEASITV